MSRIENWAHGSGVGFFFFCWSGRRGVSSSTVVWVITAVIFEGEWPDEAGEGGDGRGIN